MKESSFQFQTPILSKLDFQIANEFNPEEKTHFQNEFRIGYKHDSGVKNAIVELTIVVGSENGSENVPYKLVLVIGANFRWEAELADEMLENLLTINAPALLVSYARPIIASVTNSSGRAPFSLPFIDFTDKSPEKDFLQIEDK